MSSKFSGRSIIVSAPSGAGKTTLVKHLLKNRKYISFSISATNRPIREFEKDGTDYYFLDTETFKQKIKAGEFLEWEEVYEERFYGTLKTEVERIWKTEKHVIFDVDVDGGIQLKKNFKENALSIFVSPGELNTLENRLRRRATDPEQEILSRVKKARKEMKKAFRFDAIVLNEDLKKAKQDILKIVDKFISNG